MRNHFLYLAQLQQHFLILFILMSRFVNYCLLMIYHGKIFITDLHFYLIFHFENDFSSIFTTDYVKDPQNPLQHSNFELNLENISRTVPIDILVKPGIIENIHIGASCTDDEIQNYKALFQEFREVFSWSYEEMPGIDPSIVVHEIKTYPDAKPIRQFLRQIHLRKVATIKAEVEKLLCAGFIYPIPLTDWVSNIVHCQQKTRNNKTIYQLYGY